MGIIGKLFAFIMFPLSILIVMEELGLYYLYSPIDKVIFGAALMIVLEILTIVMLFLNHKPSIMNIVTAVVFISTAAAAIASGFLNIYQTEAHIILGVMMFTGALYALH